MSVQQVLQDHLDRVSRCMKAITRTCEAGAALDRFEKQQAMIYQRDMKERAALHNGEPYDAYYDLPYTKWAIIRGTYLRDTGAMP